MNTIDRLEKLSKLEFSKKEKEKFQAEFENIINFVNEIAELKLPENLLETDEAIALDSLRGDEPQPGLKQQDALLNAPQKKDGCFVAPLVVE